MAGQVFLIKKGANILGPWSKKLILEKLKTGQISEDDFISSPTLVWQPLKDLKNEFAQWTEDFTSSEDVTETQSFLDPAEPPPSPEETITDAKALLNSTKTFSAHATRISDSLNLQPREAPRETQSFRKVSDTQKPFTFFKNRSLSTTEDASTSHATEWQHKFIVTERSRSQGATNRAIRNWKWASVFILAVSVCFYFFFDRAEVFFTPKKIENTDTHIQKTINELFEKKKFNELTQLFWSLDPEGIKKLIPSHQFLYRYFMGSIAGHSHVINIFYDFNAIESHLLSEYSDEYKSALIEELYFDPSSEKNQALITKVEEGINDTKNYMVQVLESSDALRKLTFPRIMQMLIYHLGGGKCEELENSIDRLKKIEPTIKFNFPSNFADYYTHWELLHHLCRLKMGKITLENFLKNPPPAMSHIEVYPSQIFYHAWMLMEQASAFDKVVERSTAYARNIFIEPVGSLSFKYPQRILVTELVDFCTKIKKHPPLKEKITIQFELTCFLLQDQNYQVELLKWIGEKRNSLPPGLSLILENLFVNSNPFQNKDEKKHPLSLEMGSKCPLTDYYCYLYSFKQTLDQENFASFPEATLQEIESSNFFSEEHLGPWYFAWKLLRSTTSGEDKPLQKEVEQIWEEAIDKYPDNLMLSHIREDRDTAPR